MKGVSFTIKVSDILLHSGSHDILSFEKTFSKKLSSLHENGMSFEILLENLNKSEVLVTIPTGVAHLLSVCDRCGKEFVEKRTIKNITIQARVLSKPSIEEDILQIDPKDLTIDIESYIVDQFLLNQPVKNLCTICEKSTIDNDNEKHEQANKVVRK